MSISVWRGRRVFVTGHTGFKGAWLTEWLLQAGAEVYGYSLDVPTQPSLHEVLGHSDGTYPSGKLHHHWGDVRDARKLDASLREFQPQVIFHLAAQPLVRESYDDPVTTFETNILGSVYLLDSVRKMKGVQALVHITSDKCYENFEKPVGYIETDPMGGKDPYSASKGAAELVFSSFFRSYFQDSETKIATARAGNVIGGGDWAKDRIVPDCFRAWKKSEPVVIRNPQSVRPWQHVLEPVGGYIRLAQELLNPQYSRGHSLQGSAFNFGPDESAQKTVQELLEQVQKSVHFDFPLWKIDPSQIGNKKEAGLLSLNCEKAAKILGWRGVLNFSETLQWTADGYMPWVKDPHPKGGSDSSKSELANLIRQQLKKYIERVEKLDQKRIEAKP